MIFRMGWRAMTGIDPRLAATFAWTCGVKGIRSVELHKRRLAKGEYFPPFLFLSIASACNLICAARDAGWMSRGRRAAWRPPTPTA